MSRIVIFLILTATVLLLCGVATAQPAAGEIVPVIQKQEGTIRDKPGWQEITWSVRLGQVSLTDRSQRDENGDLQDLRTTAHSFISKSNGGWSRWGMLKIFLETPEGAVIGPFPNQSPDHVLALESGSRAMVHYVYPLTGDPLGEDVKGTLGLRVCRFPGDDYTYFEISIDLPGHTISRIWLEGYPATTKGPGWENRTRWVATSEAQTETVPPARHPGDLNSLIYFNRGSQEDSGMLLVWLAEEVDHLIVRGSYGVQTDLHLVPGRDRARFAVSEWIDRHYEEMTEHFFGEQAPQAIRTLAEMDWSADLDRLLTAGDRQLYAELSAETQLQAVFGERMAELQTAMQAAFERAGSDDTGEARQAEIEYAILGSRLRELSREMIALWIKEGMWDVP